MVVEKQRFLYGSDVAAPTNFAARLAKVSSFGKSLFTCLFSLR